MNTIDIEIVAKKKEQPTLSDIDKGLADDMLLSISQRGTKQHLSP
jgi:hypothetical protein